MRHACLLLGFFLLVGFPAAQGQETATEDAPAVVADEVTPEAEAAEAPAAETEPAEAATESETAEPEEAPSEAPAGDAASDEAVEADDTTDTEAEADEVEPDEATEAEEPGFDWGGAVERFPAFFALMHHAAVHLPIALWIFGAFFVLVGVVAPSWRNQIPLACLIGGMVTGVASVASGWWYAQYEYADEWAFADLTDGERLAEGLVQHRWLGVLLVIASVVLSVIALVSQAKQSKKLGFVWRVGLLLLAAGVSWEGHIGGELIMGEGFLEEAAVEWLWPEAE